MGERKITHYIGSVEYIYENGITKAKRYIGNLVIDIRENTSSRDRWYYSYLLKDHLGSTQIVIDQLGNPTTQMSFNAWGQRRKAPSIEDPQNYAPIPMSEVWSNQGLGLRESIENTTNRGFTGHEHFDQVGIIHMNGRIYDPEIGRFLQADSIIQDPYNTQSLNRYSYVMNNPLSYTDPTGHTRLRKGAGKQILRIAAAIFVTVYSAGATNELLADELITAYQAIAYSAAAGAVSGAIATGNLKGAVKGAIFAVVTFGIGHGFDGSGGIGEEGSNLRIFAHSVASGVSAEVDGGHFGHGFASAILTQSLGQGRIFDAKKVGGRAIVSNAILQGTISEITGGKFANGAMSAAFRVAFNDTLKFDGKKLTRFDDDGNVVAEYPALSGRPSKVINKGGKKYKTKDYTTSENQGEIGLGPIPEGNYVALQADFQEISTKDKVLGFIGRGAWPGGTYSWGESRVWLTPAPGNDALFRGGFSIHGGTVFGSAGCVDLCTSMSRFSQDFKDYGKDILLRVDYSEQK